MRPVASDVSLDEVTAHARVRPHRPLQVDQPALSKRPKTGHPRRLGRDFGLERVPISVNGGQTDTVDGDALTQDQLDRQRRRDTNPEAGRYRLQFGHFAHRLNQTVEHLSP